MSARWVVVLVIGSNLLTLGIVFGVRWHDDTYRFNVAKWHAAKPGFCKDSHRQDMVGDLAKGSYLRVGMPRAEVIWLLGLPDYTNTEKPTTVSGWDTGVVDASSCAEFLVDFGPKGQRVVDWASSTTNDPAPWTR
jgi:hypothetical protein